jgi:hypothetical protein
MTGSLMVLSYEWSGRGRGRFACAGLRKSPNWDVASGSIDELESGRDYMDKIEAVKSENQQSDINSQRSQPM